MEIIHAEMELIHALYKLKIETTDHSSSQEEEEDKRNWLDLPPDVTSLIFLKLRTVDILGSVQWVCSSWWKLSKQPHLYRSIHVENVVSIFGYNLDLGHPKPYEFLDADQKKKYKLLAKLSDGLAREAIDRSCGQLVEFSVRDMPIDELLPYMSEKSSSLRSLRLVKVKLVVYDSYKYNDYLDYLVTKDDFIEEIAKKLPHLEGVEFIKCSDFSKDVIKTFGRFCPQLKSCRLNYGRSCSLDKTEFNDVALAIAENMPELRHLNLFGNKMRHYNLTTILDGCPHLESLDLRRCFYYNLGEDLEERCKNIKVLRLPNDPTDDFEYDSDDEYEDDYSDDDDDDDNFGRPNEYFETDPWSP